MIMREDKSISNLTWNPITGCTKISPACQNCYAEKIAKNLQKQGVIGYANGFALTLHPDRLNQPLKRKSPTFYFAGSMTDFFHHDVPDNFLDDIMSVMQSSPHHTYMVLTKRAERLPIYFSSRFCPKNLWLGVTVENKEHGLPRMNYLRQVDAALRFINIEPLLEDLGKIDLSGIGWVTLGGETGSGARQMKKVWVEKIRDQVTTAGIPFCFLKWGEWGEDGIRHGKNRTGRLLSGRIWDEKPQLQVKIVMDEKQTSSQFSFDF